MARSDGSSGTAVRTSSSSRSKPVNGDERYARQPSGYQAPRGDPAATNGRNRSEPRDVRIGAGNGAGRPPSRGRSVDSRSMNDSDIITMARGKIHLNAIDKHSRANSPSNHHAAGCICELCNCGIHHCPIKPKRVPRRQSPFVGKSGYRDDYREYGANELDRRTPYNVRTKSSLWNNMGGGIGQTTNKSDYPRYSEEHFRRHDTPKKREYNPLPFEGQSRYRSDYVEKIPEKVLRGGANYKNKWMPTGKLDGVTTNRHDFNLKEIPAFQPPARQKARTPLPFEGKSEYRDRFPQHKFDPDNFKARRAHDPSGLWSKDRTTDYTTTYRDNHDEKRIEPEVPKERPPYKPNNLPTGTTTQRTAFVPHPPQRARSCPASRKDTQPWSREKANYVTEHQATIGEVGRTVRNCPAAVLTAAYPVERPPTGRSHIYFDDYAKRWY
eukprot:GEMP01027889.1.p1 GENE.GEMP01027889.1~~GEMP01027889.1.p1  ORF type:complete len:439 (+),score=92.17 GEMP01027889.1:191-1507(+)